jgi:2'-5' RNA ligase superfamily
LDERSKLTAVWLLLITRAAEPLVAKWRADHDAAARDGIPAHVTVRTPFLPAEEWNDPRLAALSDFLPLELTLARLENRPGALVIVVEPDHALRELTDAVGSAWPNLPPHRGNRPDLAYHLTVVRTEDEAVRSEAAAEISPHLPLKVSGTELWASEGILGKHLKHAVVAT